MNLIREIFPCAMVYSDKTLGTKAGKLISDGCSVEESGNTQKALELFNAAVVTDPAISIAWFNKGVCYAKLNHHESALTCFVKSTELDSWAHKAWYKRGITEYHLGMIQASGQSMVHYVELEQQNEYNIRQQNIAYDILREYDVRYSPSSQEQRFRLERTDREFNIVDDPTLIAVRRVNKWQNLHRENYRDKLLDIDDATLAAHVFPQTDFYNDASMRRHFGSWALPVWIFGNS